MEIRRRVAVGVAAAVAALVFVGLFAAGGNSVLAANIPINVKPATITNVSCGPEGTAEWHFVITGIKSGVSAPASITVTWDGALSATDPKNPQVVPLQKVSGGVAHYVTTDFLDRNVISATASISD